MKKPTNNDKETNDVKKTKFKKRKGPKKSTVQKLPETIIPNSNWEAFLKSQKDVVVVKKPVFKPKTFKKKAKEKLNTEKKPEIWFDNVDPSLIENSSNGDSVKTTNENTEEEIVSENVTRYVALDCEMVGVGDKGKESVLARVSMVNSLGDCVYDKFVKTIERVTDYRTKFSGVRSENLKNAPEFSTVQKDVADLLKGRILVGHALQNDLKVLMLSHPRRQIRDTAKYKPFHKQFKTKRPALRKLAKEILNEQIQEGEHSSVIDARATMRIFLKHKKDWEKSLRNKNVKNDSEEKNKVVFISKDDIKPKKKMNKWAKIKQKRKKKEMEDSN